MPDSSHEVQELDARLAELDDRLREIQAELAPESDDDAGGRGRSGPLADVLRNSPHDSQRLQDHLVQQIEDLTALHVSLLSAMSEMLGAFQRTVAQMPQPRSSELTVSAGPFSTVEAVHEFERRLAALPEVREAVVRGYEGEDRALIDVQLTPPSA